MPLNDEQINDIWKSKSTVFIIDANILLNLYTYHKETQNDFYKILIALQDKIWIPYHVLVEYHRNRVKAIDTKNEIIKNAIDIYSNFTLEIKSDILSEDEKNIPNEYKEFKRKYPGIVKKWDEIEENIKKEFKKKITDYISEIKKITDNGVSLEKPDEVYNKLEILLKNTGVPYDEKFINDISEDGEKRFNDKRPPGYSDENRKNNKVYYHKGIKIPYKYGDLIIWEELKQYVSEKKSIKNVIFVTDDNKEDWVQKCSSNISKVLMARCELFDELLEKANHVKTFMICNSERFVNNSNQILGLDLKTDSVKDVKNTWNFLKSHNPLIKSKLNHRLYYKNIDDDIFDFDFDSDQNYLDFLMSRRELKGHNEHYIVIQKTLLMDLISDCERDIKNTKNFLLATKNKGNITKYEDRIKYLENKISKYISHIKDIEIYNLL